MDNKEPLYFTAVLVGFLALLTVCSYWGRSVSAAETKEVRHYAELSNLVAEAEIYYVEAFTNKPPEEDAESLVRHRNRATPLDKNPKRMLKYAPENKAYYEPTLIVK